MADMGAMLESCTWTDLKHRVDRVIEVSFDRDVTNSKQPLSSNTLVSASGLHRAQMAVWHRAAQR